MVVCWFGDCMLARLAKYLKMSDIKSESGNLSSDSGKVGKVDSHNETETALHLACLYASGPKACFIVGKVLKPKSGL